MDVPPARSLTAFFRASMRLGAGAFGSSQRVEGRLARGLVEQGWLSEPEHASVLELVELLPGSPAANTLALAGQRLGGWTWSLAAVLGYVLPGAVLTLLAAIAYVRWDLGTRAEFLFAGFGAGAVGSILGLALRRIRGTVTARWQMLVLAGALILTVAGKASPVEVVLLGAAAGLAVEVGLRRRRNEGHPPERSPGASATGPLRTGLLALAASTAAVAHASGLDVQVVEALVLYFRTGVGAYGGGLAVIPHLSERLDALDWLTRRQFADAVSVALLTPGPILLVSTFAGYVHRGLSGAAASTLALLAAPWLLVRLAGPWLARVRTHPVARAAARGLQPAVIGLVGSAALVLGASFHGPVSLGLAAVVALVFVRFETNPAALVAAAGVARAALHVAGV